MFFEEYINFKMFHYLSHCGVIHVQNLGSYIRPQLPGLGLSSMIMNFPIHYNTLPIYFIELLYLSRDCRARLLRRKMSWKNKDNWKVNTSCFQSFNCLVVVYSNNYIEDAPRQKATIADHISMLISFGRYEICIQVDYFGSIFSFSYFRYAYFLLNLINKRQKIKINNSQVSCQITSILTRSCNSTLVYYS